jgi:hypothetical protein
MAWVGNTKVCNPEVVRMLKATNWNKVHGDAQDIINLELLRKCVSPNEFSDIFISQNKAFVHNLLTAIYAKNKLDYPPLGPMSESKQTFQHQKIMAILESIMIKEQSEYNQFNFGKLGVQKMVSSAADSAATLGMNVVRGIERSVSEPKSTLTKTKESMKHMLGLTQKWNLAGNKGGRRKQHRKTSKRKHV